MAASGALVAGLVNLALRRSITSTRSWLRTNGADSARISRIARSSSAADHDPIRPHDVGHRGAFLQKLGVRDQVKSTATPRSLVQRGMTKRDEACRLLGGVVAEFRPEPARAPHGPLGAASAMVGPEPVMLDDDASHLHSASALRLTDSVTRISIAHDSLVCVSRH